MPTLGFAAACVVLWPDVSDSGYAWPFLIAGGVSFVGLLLQAVALGKVLKTFNALTLVGQALDQWARQEPDPAALLITNNTAAPSRQWNELIQQQHHARLTDLEDRLIHDASATSGQGQTDSTLDALPHGVVIVGTNRIVASANGAACRLLCRSHERLLLAPLNQIVGDHNFLAVLDRVLAGTDARGGAVELNYEASEDQSAIIRATIRPLGTSGGDNALIVFEDVTQQRTADQSRNLFVAQATHELRTPLTNIALYLERAIDLDDDETADRAECLNVINSEVLRLGRVVEEVLSVSQIEAGSMKIGRDDLRIEQLVENLEAEYAAQAKKKDITLGFDLPPKMPVLQGDRDKVALALHNLLGNAIKYTTAGGSVRVQVDHDERALTFAVTDTGIGIAESDLGKVFEKFYRADDDRLRDIAGSGLGLALAREVIRLHGGDITVKSTFNQGSTFTLLLPLHDHATI